MSDFRAVHPRYASLPASAATSEVMASKYAAAASKISESAEDQEYIQGAIEEWAQHVKEEGLTMSTQHLAVFADICLALTKNKMGDLIGKLAVGVTDVMRAAFLEGSVVGSNVSKLENISTALLTGIDEVKKLADTLAASLPRKNIKAHRTTKPSPSIIAEPSPEEEPVNTDLELATGSGSNSHKDKGKQATTDAEMKETEENAGQTPSISPGDIEKNRNLVRIHYSYDGFTALSDDKKIQVIEYYLENVLGISKSVLSNDPMLQQMLFDIVDKERVMNMCRLARNDSVTSTHILESAEEAQDAIEACRALYGPYVGEVVSGTTGIKLVVKLAPN